MESSLKFQVFIYALFNFSSTKNLADNQISILSALPLFHVRVALFMHRCIEEDLNNTTMKLSIALILLATAGSATAFVVPSSSNRSAATALSAEDNKKWESTVSAEIRKGGFTTKNEVLEFGWDGTTALGGAVVDSQPARMLDEIRASGETQNSACDLFNANLGECKK